MPRITALLFLFSFCFKLSAQNDDTLATKSLDEVIVKAYEQHGKLRNIPAAINFLNKSALERFHAGSIVHAINTTPGVRMEERSPGSFRFSIRGSSLRSPFGVRNVKIYFNDLPYTDPGGHSYLNQLGFYNFNSVEVIKGPGNSLYGAGTGGVLLIESLDEQARPGLTTEYATGSFGLHNFYASVTAGSEKMLNRAGFQHQESRGYRNHSQLRRDVHSWSGLFRFGKNNQLKTSFIYGDLFYETPGALTLAEFKANPRASRPGGFGFPGAEQSKAAIFQKTFLAGASYLQQLGSKWQNKSSLYGMFTELKNPTIRNYGRASEPHLGGRTVFTYKKPLRSALFSINAGGEFQEGFTTVSIHKNVNGNPDSLQTDDEINNRQSFIFAQSSLNIGEWMFMASASWNWLRVRFQRFTPATAGRQTRKFNNEIAPRFSMLRKLKNISIYASIAKGFSPPTTAELLPTGGAINLDLNAEDGVSYDAGVKGTFFNKLFIGIDAFIFSLNNTIVQRRDAGGGDFFVNAGRTKQHGIETYISYPFLESSPFIKRGFAWLSHTWHNFHYKEFKQLTFDFSGNQLPGVPPHTISAGLDLLAEKGFLATLTYYFNDKIPLTDANSEYADAYHLVSGKLGFEKWLRGSWRLKIFGGVENIFDEVYSLGNDINGFGGRYYNAAPGRNYYASVVLQWAK